MICEDHEAHLCRWLYKCQHMRQILPEWFFNSKEPDSLCSLNEFPQRCIGIIIVNFMYFVKNGLLSSWFTCMSITKVLFFCHAFIAIIIIQASNHLMFF